MVDEQDAPRNAAGVSNPGATLPSLLRKPIILACTALPHVVEGILGPMASFLTGRHLYGLVGGIGFAFGWTAICMGIRFATGRRSSGLLTIAMITVVLRTLAGLVAHSSRAYFLGPDIATFGMGLTFVISALAGRPLIGRVLSDILPRDWFDVTRPEAARLCRLASIAWGFEQMIASVVTAFLLFNVNTTDYVTFHEPVSLGVFGMVMAVWLPLLLPEVRTVRRTCNLAELPPPVVVDASALAVAS